MARREDSWGSPEPGSPSATPSLRFGLLGPFSVEIDGRPVELPGTRTKAVLAILLAQANRVVSTDRLVDDVWAGEPTPGATTTLQGYVSDLRKALADALGAPAPVRTRRPGYVVEIEPDQLDVLRFEQRVHEAKATSPDEPAVRARLLREAVAQWRGPALADFAGEPFARPIAARLEESRLWALEERVQAELDAGEHGELITELGTLTAENPLRERLWGQLMVALYRCGRQADALRAYQSLRRHLGEELAIEPSPALRRLEHAILTQDPSLEPAEVRPERPPAAAAADPRAARREHLPVNLTRFVGRQRELDETRQLLSDTRLLTLAGSGGSGKTRLAVELVGREPDRWPDGAYFVDLSALEKPGLVPGAVAASMGLSELGADEGAICAYLGDADALLLLDNCEHVVDACADLVEAVLSNCPRVTVLATSQEELRIGSETVWRVPPLSLPPVGDAQPVEPEQMLGSEAVQLFLDRASAPPGESLAEPPLLDSVATICQRLDGIPLAIELAASLVAVLPVDEVARRLDDRLALLTRNNRRTVSRHRTLRAAIEWSYELLGDSERELFQRLSVFVRQFSVDAAEAASAGALTFLSDLSALVSKSMVVIVPRPGGTRRCQLLDSLRLFGLEKLRESGREPDARNRHAAYYMSFTMAAEEQHHGPDSADWTKRVIAELPNIRAALAWSFSDGDYLVGVETAAALRCGYFARMDHLVEAREWLEHALDPGRGLSPPLRLKALTAAMTVAFSQGDFRWTCAVGEEAVALAEELDDPRELAFTLMARGSAAVFEGRVERAKECLERSLAYCDEIGDEWTAASALTFLGVVSRRLGHADDARARLTEALSVYRRLDDDFSQVVPLLQLALAAQTAGDLDEAMQWCDDALALARRVGDRQLAHGALCIAGVVELARGRTEQARHLLVDSLTSARGLEHYIFVALALDGLAVVAHVDGRHFDAAQLWGVSDELRSTRAVPLNAERRAQRDRWWETGRSEIGTIPFDQAMAAGRHLPYSQVLDQLTARPASRPVHTSA
ncbi:MAG: BTAD domain-containing putative transcriptional regulator [Acidimicrobiales bacterium]